MNSRALQELIEQATSADLSKPDLNINKRICFAIRDSESLYSCSLLCRASDAVRGIKSRLVKKNPTIQCLALELLENAIRNCSPALHQQVATEHFMNILLKLVRLPDIDLTVLFVRPSRCKIGFLRWCRCARCTSKARRIGTRRFKGRMKGCSRPGSPSRRRGCLLPNC